jgi:hypothetical protein
MQTYTFWPDAFPELSGPEILNLMKPVTASSPNEANKKFRALGSGKLFVEAPSLTRVKRENGLHEK